MDFLKDAVNQVKGATGGNKDNKGSSSAGNEDYADKGKLPSWGRFVYTCSGFHVG